MIVKPRQSRRDAEFTEFVNARGDDLLRAAHALTGQRQLAEDLVQVSLIKTYIAWSSATRHDAYAYARRVLVTTNIDMWRRRRWRETSSADPAHDDRPAVSGDQTERVAEVDAVMAALGQLAPRERTVLVLRYGEDLSERDVADLLNVTVGTVKATASRALAKLRVDPSLTHAHAPEVNHAHH
jgi:RNA polymerase sigma-70 factor (sigma-E family)